MALTPKEEEDQMILDPLEKEEDQMVLALKEEAQD